MLDELVKEARGWLADCGCSPVGMSDDRVIRTVHWNYSGGWPAFVQADLTMDIGDVWVWIMRRFGVRFANEMVLYP